MSRDKKKREAQINKRIDKLRDQIVEGHKKEMGTYNMYIKLPSGQTMVMDIRDLVA